jgi:hypothetical protein
MILPDTMKLTSSGRSCGEQYKPLLTPSPCLQVSICQADSGNQLMVKEDTSNRVLSEDGV